jgi:hypothetical protein
MRWALFGFAMIGMAGCASGIGKTVPVAGIVTWNGKPLEGGIIVFRPDRSKGNTGRDAHGVIEADGSYALFTASGAQEREGAAPGWYQVGVVSTKEADPGAKRIGAMPPPATSRIPIEYANPAASGLAVEVVESAPAGAYDIKLARDKGAKVARR